MIGQRICAKCAREYFGEKYALCVACRAKLAHLPTGGKPGRPLGAGRRQTANIELLRAANLEGLSPRLRAVAERMKEGQTGKQIADQLGTALGTVKVQATRVYSVLRAQRQGAAA